MLLRNKGNRKWPYKLIVITYNNNTQEMKTLL